MKAELASQRRSIVVSLCKFCVFWLHRQRIYCSSLALVVVVGTLRSLPNCACRRGPMAYNVVVVFLSWQLILPHLTVVHASTHWVVTEDGRIQAQVVSAVEGKGGRV